MVCVIHIKEDNFVIYQVSLQYLSTLNRGIFAQTNNTKTYIFTDNACYFNTIASRYTGVDIYGNVFIARLANEEPVYPNGIDIDNLANIYHQWLKEKKEEELFVDFDKLNITDSGEDYDADIKYDSDDDKYYDDIDMHYGLC